MPSRDAFKYLTQYGIKPSSADGERYLLNDGLASEDDLTGLFEVLSSVKDINSAPAVFTAISLVANPMFDKIKENGYLEYFYEPFTETLKSYPSHSKSFELWKEGFKKQIFVPQFHGREHLNVANWLKALKIGEPDTLFAFQNRTFGITPRNPINHVSYQAAFDFVDIDELKYQRIAIEDGLNLFHQIHGFKASYFMPTNGPFNNSLEGTAARSGIRFMGTAKKQDEPIGKGKSRYHFHYLGQRNSYDQRYITRNCFFEPSSRLKQDWVDACMSEIEIAFRWHKPAVVSSHRVNYIGWINPTNRDKGLRDLEVLLKSIITQWPDVEFLTSNKLGYEISQLKTGDQPTNHKWH